MNWLFDNPLTKYLIFKKITFLHARAVLGYLPKLKGGLGLACFLDDFSIKMFLILYSMGKLSMP